MKHTLTRVQPMVTERKGGEYSTTLMQRFGKRLSTASLGLAAATLVAGCTVKSVPLSVEETTERGRADQASLYSAQEPIEGPIGLGEAIVRSIRYNLDSRVKFMELAVAMRQLDFSNKALIPNLVARAGYSDRSNDPGARSINLETGAESLPPSRSQERTRSTQNLEFQWNLLDFGISYHNAHQSAAEVEIAKERQRKTIQNIAQDVVGAYWKAWIAQELEEKMGGLIASVEDALNYSNTLANSQSQSRQEALKYQSNLLSIRNSLYEMQERMGLAKTRLAALINENPKADFTLSDPSAELAPKEITRRYEWLADIALTMRPELREEDYRLRISQREVKKAMLSMFPQVTIGTGYHADQNEFLINEDWTDVSLDISWNILALFTAGSQKKFREAQVELANARRMALSMAVITQVRLSLKRYAMSLKRYHAAKELTDVNMEYAQIIEASSKESALDKITAGTDALVSQLRTNFAYAETQSAFARIVNSLGLDIMPTHFASNRSMEMGEEFETHWANLQGEYF